MNFKGSCSGDSGGPLIFNGTAVGITSFGFRPCGGSLPDAFERVFPHLDFIQQNILTPWKIINKMSLDKVIHVYL